MGTENTKIHTQKSWVMITLACQLLKEKDEKNLTISAILLKKIVLTNIKILFRFTIQFPHKNNLKTKNTHKYYQIVFYSKTKPYKD